MKTNVMRLLEGMKLPYRAHYYEAEAVPSGVEVADMLRQPRERVFKTLVTVGKSGRYYVFVIPVALELNLKKAARASGEKAIEMIKSKDLLPLTGYVHGGCSPIGMKKPFPIFVEESVTSLETVFFSAGKVGAQVEMKPADFRKAVCYVTADLT